MQNPTPQSQMSTFAEWKTCDTVGFEKSLSLVLRGSEIVHVLVVSNKKSRIRSRQRHKEKYPNHLVMLRLTG